jgi:NADH-quinone oxidoreductase subunit C
MIDPLQTVIAAVQLHFTARVAESHGETTLFVPASEILHLARALRDEFQFSMLADVTAVDYWPQETGRFHVVYQLTSLALNLRLRLRVALDGNAPHIPSLVEVFPNANWLEREVWDLFGICFDDHPDLRRILMPYDWEGHPLRKDYPLGYEEPQFSFNYKEIGLRKLKGQK